MIRYNEAVEETNYKKEQKYYNLEKYDLLNKLSNFEANNKYMKITLKDSFPYQLIVSSNTNGVENILVIVYDQPQIFEMEIIPEIIVRYSMCTSVKSSYFQDQNYLAIMENDTILELKDFDEKIINKLVGHIEKIQEITGYGDDFSSKLQVEEEKENVSRNRGVANSIWRSMGSIFRGLFKFIFICIGGLIAISIIGALVTCIISILGFFFLGTATITTPFFSIFPGGMHVLNGHWELVVFTLSLFFTFGIPLYAILRAVLGSIFHWKAQSSALNIFLLVLWILSLVGLFVSTFIYMPEYPLLNL